MKKKPVQIEIKGVGDISFQGALAALKAAQPIKPKKPQEFDLGALPLFGDQAKQKEMF